MKVEAVYFDMDGTIANLYAVEDWLPMLLNHNPTPYAKAKVMLNMNTLAKLLNLLQKQGIKIGVISWLARGSNKEYDEKVTAVKKKWLKKHLTSVKFDEIIIAPYGMPKHNLSHYKGILFDDEEKNRTEWNKSSPKNAAFDEKNILKILKKVLKNS